MYGLKYIKIQNTDKIFVIYSMWLLCSTSPEMKEMCVGGN